MPNPSSRFLPFALLFTALLASGVCFFLIGMGSLDSSPTPLEGPTPIREISKVGSDRSTELRAASFAPAQQASTGQIAARAPVEIQAEDATPPLAASTPILAFGGSVVVHERDGTDSLDANGVLEVTFWHEGSGGGFEADVERGQWEISLGAAELGELLELPSHTFKQGGPAPTATPDVFISSDGFVVQMDDEAELNLASIDNMLEFRRVGPIQLIVTDAQTGQQLTQVEVRRMTDWSQRSYAHPGGNPSIVSIVRDTPSPIGFAPNEHENYSPYIDCLVGSPGYAWAPIEIDFSLSAPHEIALQKSGSFTVFLNVDPNQPGAQLRVRTKDEYSILATHEVTGTGPFEFLDFAPGEYDLAVEVGQWFRSHQTLGSGHVVVSAGESSEITLTVEVQPEVVTAPFSGLLILPEQWQPSTRILSLDLLGTPLDGSDGHHFLRASSLQQVEDRPGVFHFDFGQRQVGRYQLELMEPTYSVEVNLRPGGETDFQFEIPPPREVAVRFVDVTTGDTADIDEITWACKRPDGVGGGICEVANREPGDDWFHFTTPEAEFAVDFSTLEYLVVQGSPEYLNEAENIVELQPTAGALMVLQSGETDIPWPSEDWWDFERISDEGHIYTYSDREDGFWICASPPGRFLIEIPKAPGYEQHEPVEVEFIAGETKTFIVHLVPEEG